MAIKKPELSLLKKNNMSFVKVDGKCSFDAVMKLKWVCLTTEETDHKRINNLLNIFRNAFTYAFQNTERPVDQIPFRRPLLSGIKNVLKWGSDSHETNLRSYETLFSY